MKSRKIRRCTLRFSLERVERSEAEWGCLNTGDGCNRILSLNDGQQAEHAIASSQLVEREEEKNRDTFTALTLLGEDIHAVEHQLKQKPT